MVANEDNIRSAENVINKFKKEQESNQIIWLNKICSFGSNLFAVIRKMSSISPIYLTSLPQYYSVFRSTLMEGIDYICILANRSFSYGRK